MNDRNVPAHAVRGETPGRPGPPAPAAPDAAAPEPAAPDAAAPEPAAPEPAASEPAAPKAGPAPRVRRRRRGRALENAIFVTVVDLLQTVGFADLTMDGVAQAAGTGKAALYRRWADKSSLVVDALDHLLPSVEDLPDQGGVRADLLQLLQDKADTLNSPVGRAMQSLLAEIKRDWPFLDLIDKHVFAPRQQMFEDILVRGRRRGEVAPGPMSPLVAEVGPALLLHRFLGDQAPIPREFIVEIVDGVLLPLVRGQAGHVARAE